MNTNMKLLKLFNKTNMGVYGYNYFCLPAKFYSNEYNLFFNFMLAHKDVEDRIFYTNSLIQKFWNQWEQMQKERTLKPENITYIDYINSHYNLLFHYYTGRDIVMNLKKITDECIVLYCVASKKYCSDGTLLEDIGEYINQNEKFKDLNADLYFLKVLNKLANACKHSLISENNKVGKNEPCLYAYETKRYKSGKHLYLLNEFGYTLNSLVEQFNTFYSNFQNLLNTIQL